VKTILSEAVAWYVRLNDSAVTELQRAHWRRWLEADPRHAQAWARIEQLERRFDQAPRGVASRTLESARRDRRAALKTLALLLGVGVVGWQGYQASPWSADYATRVGERRRVTLADGSRLHLDTDTRVDVRFDAGQRLIRLGQGEILVETGRDSRPLGVQTGEGQVLARDGRFVVRRGDGLSRVTVDTARVEVRPLLAALPPVQVAAGQRLSFAADTVGTLHAAPADASAWTRGMLVAVDWRLEDFLAELSRYRHGYLGCDREIAGLRLSGAFTLDDTDAVLANLEASLPVQVRRRTRYWVRLDRREPATGA
jgi:transmembrane sensor